MNVPDLLPLGHRKKDGSGRLVFIDDELGMKRIHDGDLQKLFQRPGVHATKRPADRIDRHAGILQRDDAQDRFGIRRAENDLRNGLVAEKRHSGKTILAFDRLSIRQFVHALSLGTNACLNQTIPRRHAVDGARIDQKLRLPGLGILGEVGNLRGDVRDAHVSLLPRSRTTIKPTPSAFTRQHGVGISRSEEGGSTGALPEAVKYRCQPHARRMEEPVSTLPFAHLHCHSHYSLLDGAGTIRGLLERAKALRMTALALTDHGNLHGAIKFYQTARELGINPILGIEAYIAPGSRFHKEGGGSKENSYHLTLLARDAAGFRNLVQLSSAAFLEGFYFKPRIDKELLAAHREGLICLSGCASSELSRTLLAGGEANFEKALEIAAWYRQLFGNDYYIEIQNNHLEAQRAVMEGAVRVAERLGIPLVATSDVHYINREDAEAQDILLCVNTGKFRTDTNRMRMETNEFFLRSPEEMYAAFPGMDDALRRTQEIADSVHIELELGKRHFPVYSPPDGKTPEEFLRELCVKGLRERYANRPDRYREGLGARGGG